MSSSPSEGFSCQQTFALGVFGVMHFGNALCISMLAPLYPLEAEGKGNTASGTGIYVHDCISSTIRPCLLTFSEYGLVFGIFEFIIFVSFPVIGANMNHLGVYKTATF